MGTTSVGIGLAELIHEIDDFGQLIDRFVELFVASLSRASTAICWT